MIHPAITGRIRRVLTVALLLSVSAGMLHGQPFISVQTGLAAAGRSAIALADYDSDGDVDLFIAGLGSDGERVAILYRNDQGTFTEVQTGIGGFKECSAAWGDMDGDADLDLLVSGNTASGDLTRIYRNDAGLFTPSDDELAPVQGGEVCWMDFDSDGDLDIFITGSWVAKIYENRNGSFEPLSQEFGLFSSSAADWGDFDLDGDLDLLISGDSGAGAVSMIFRNDGGIFADIGAGLDGLMSGTADWVDYNNDGNLDVALSGYNDALEAEFFLFKNTGLGQFSYAYTAIEGFATGDADWGDWDNDGDLDMVMSGKATGCGALVSGIYRNDGNDLFYKMSYTIFQAIRCALQWVDMENDGDLDLLMAGMDIGESPHTILYRNDQGSNLFTANTAPSSPAGLAEQQEDGIVLFSWDASEDDQTPPQALTYNVRLGTTAGGSEVVPSMADPATGRRLIAAPGNAGAVREMLIIYLEPGTYYWSVQGIDQGMLASEFAPVRSFTVGTTGNGELIKKYTVLYPNPAKDVIRLSREPASDDAEVAMFDLAGRCHLTVPFSSNQIRLDISGIPPGIYSLVIFSGEDREIHKLVVE